MFGNCLSFILLMNCDELCNDHLARSQRHIKEQFYRTSRLILFQYCLSVVLTSTLQELLLHLHSIHFCHKELFKLVH